MEMLPLLVVIVALIVALAMRPWRLLMNADLSSPILATLVITPWLWALPWLHRMPVHLQLSGACLIGLALGWPLAVPMLCVVTLVVGVVAPVDWQQQLDMTVWLGLIPATLGLAQPVCLHSRACILGHCSLRVFKWGAGAMDGTFAHHHRRPRFGPGGTLVDRLGRCRAYWHGGGCLRGIQASMAGHMVGSALPASAKAHSLTPPCRGVAVASMRPANLT